MSKVLVLGDGKLATELVRQTKWHSISRKKDGFNFCDLTSYAGYLKNYDTIVNCIAYTETYSPKREQHWNVNYKAVADLADYCKAFHKKLCHISTDYIYANNDNYPTEENIPLPASNWYSHTKLLADSHIQMRMENYLIARCSFKSRPFPYPFAIYQVGNFDYIDVISDLIIKLIKKNANGLFNVGTKLKTMLELAKQTNSEIQYAPDEIPEMPNNVGMDISKMNKFLGIEE